MLVLSGYRGQAGQAAAKVVASLPWREDSDREFPDDLTSSRLYYCWFIVRKEAGLAGLRIHDLRHSWASQGVMNGVGPTTVGHWLVTADGKPGVRAVVISLAMGKACALASRQVEGRRLVPLWRRWYCGSSTPRDGYARLTRGSGPGRATLL